MRISENLRDHDLVAQMADRFWGKVQIGKADECWEWTDHLRRTYGIFTVREGEILPGIRDCQIASRVSYFLSTGQWPGTRFVCHSCDNPPCVNPAHLWLGDASANTKDMWMKGRSRRNGLPHEARERVLAAIEQGQSIAATARLVGVSRPTVYKILEAER